MPKEEVWEVRSVLGPELDKLDHIIHIVLELLHMHPLSIATQVIPVKRGSRG